MNILQHVNRPSGAAVCVCAVLCAGVATAQDNLAVGQVTTAKGTPTATVQPKAVSAKTAAGMVGMKEPPFLLNIEEA